MHHPERMTELLLKTGAVQISVEKPFIWTSGIRAPIYCDVRKLYGHPRERASMTDALTERIRSLPRMPEGIAGTATAAIGWAALVAERLGLPFAYVRPMAKEHGTRKRVEGDFPKGKRILVIEDLLSTAGSAVASVAALREECAAEVTDVVAIFSYELPVAFVNARRCNVQLSPLVTIKAFLDGAEKAGDVSQSEAEEIRAFLQNPEGWGMKRDKKLTAQSSIV
ncbi:orotate phosphoribosyltransferase [Candidatus Peregrinibacteria bacterium]|nr:orotate phosphoribosyltransferase [Candidatus Peregrinibacteria bacterium]